jgi:ABC-type Fe2+-enterobactin transport system substrate-binding protein
MSIDNIDKKTYGELMYRLGQMDAILQDMNSTIARFHEESRSIREAHPPELVNALNEALQRTAHTPTDAQRQEEEEE